jgi:hypothetical protein
MNKNRDNKNGGDKLIIIRYEWVLKHLPFFLFLALLTILYIANGHWADNTLKNTNAANRSVKELEYEYKSLKSLEMFRSREAQVVKASEPLNLFIPEEAPVQLEVSNVNTTSSAK